MPHFKATNAETSEVVEYDAEAPQAEHLVPPWRLEEVAGGTIAPEAPPPPFIAEAWHIGVGPFWDRFGQYKIAILASADPVVQAIIKDSSVRKYLDLKGRRSDLESALNVLISKGFPLDKKSILDTQPTLAEIYRG